MPAITAFRVQTKKVGGRKASDPLPANRKAALLQSALPWTITDSTPSTHRWASAYGLFSVPPALFKRGCPPRSTRRAVFPSGSSYFAAARIGCSETVFHPSAFGLRASFRRSPPSGEAEPLHLPLSRMALRYRFLSPALLRGSISWLFMSFTRLSPLSLLTGWPALR